MNIKIELINALSSEGMHLEISTPDGSCYNFFVPKTNIDKYEYNYSYKSMIALHKLLAKFINR